MPNFPDRRAPKPKKPDRVVFKPEKEAPSKSPDTGKKPLRPFQRPPKPGTIPKPNPVGPEKERPTYQARKSIPKPATRFPVPSKTQEVTKGTAPKKQPSGLGKIAKTAGRVASGIEVAKAISDAFDKHLKDNPVPETRRKKTGNCPTTDSRDASGRRCGNRAASVRGKTAGYEGFKGVENGKVKEGPKTRPTLDQTQDRIRNLKQSREARKREAALKEKRETAAFERSRKEKAEAMENSPLKKKLNEQSPLGKVEKREGESYFENLQRKKKAKGREIFDRLKSFDE